uniref:VHS domain-containing protein n=1 Tax=Kalmanozyma brasiliensis (strain GHG001) TaxID=1365824 RepID=V5ELP2_KALBG
MKKFFKGKEAGTITPLPPASPPVSSPSFGTPRLFEEYQARVASQTASAESNRPLSYQAPSLSSHHPRESSDEARYAQSHLSQDSDDSDRAAYDDTAAPRSTAYPVYAGPEGEGDAGEVLISQGRYEETTLRDPPKDKSKGMKLFGFSTGSNKDKKAKQHRDDAPSSSPVPRSSRDRDDAHLMSPPVDAHPDSAPERSREGGWMDRWKKGAHQYQAARLQDKEAEDLVASRIGWITANAHEEQDWMHVLPIIDLVSQSEAASKEAARALRKEFKYGTVDTQRRAVRLWALLTLNASDRFRLQVASRRFLESIEDTIASSKTPLSVKETMLRVLGVLAFEFRNDADLAAPTWQLPTSNGGPVDIISNLEAAAASMESKSYPASIASQHDIVAADEDVRRLHEECQIARSNAAVLLDTLLHEGLHGDTAELIDEFYGKVVHAQELIASQIAWASAQVERAKMAGGEGREEALLADLLEAHGRTSEAVRAVDEARRVAEEEEEERRVTERSKVEHR